MVSIEIEDRSGKWHRYTIVSANARSIVNALKAAVETELASSTKKARAVDLKTGEVIDYLQDAGERLQS
jgi:hypothetical protein